MGLFTRKRQGKESLGRRGEEAACSFLKRKGYTIVERNYRRRHGELDIIARDGATLVFVEVKTRQSRQYGSPFEAVDYRKQRQISRMALDYLQARKISDTPLRFDVVAVILHGEKGECQHLCNAFEAQE
jgi:putative endonuclease